MKLFLSVLLLASTAMANECPNFSGTYNCPLGDGPLEFSTTVENGISTYTGTIFDINPIVADVVERDVGSHYPHLTDPRRYVAYCSDQNLVIVKKYLNDSETPKTEWGSRVIYYMDGDTLRAQQRSWGEYPQRLPREVNWEKDTKGRKVDKDPSFFCFKQ